MKRGSSGLSLVVGIDKPEGMTSHDVVNRVRRVFGERRVGHTGTLDPFASGVLPVCVGPATRLDAYLTGHDKAYIAAIAFGVGTDTDDCDGAIVQVGEPPACLEDERFARTILNSFVGTSNQLPPAYSALKVGGRKACDAARSGTVLELTPRPITVYEAELIAIGEAPFQDRVCVTWTVSFKVSKGTYIRAFARDIGIAAGCPASLAALRRTQVADLGLDACVTLDVLAEVRERAALDPVALLGNRLIFARDGLATRVRNGGWLDPARVTVYDVPSPQARELCACTAAVRPSIAPLASDELLSVVEGARLLAIYGFDEDKGRLEPRCVFQEGVWRGSDI